MLNGRLLWPLQRLLKIKLLNEDGDFVEYWLDLALTTIPENLGNLDLISKFVSVRKALSDVALQGFSVGNIVGCVHVIPEIATSSQTEYRRNERWIVNSHIDLATWNDVYNYSRENCILWAGRKNARRDIHSVTNCIPILMQLCTQRTSSDEWPQLATMRE